MNVMAKSPDVKEELKKNWDNLRNAVGQKAEDVKKHPVILPVLAAGLLYLVEEMRAKRNGVSGPEQLHNDLDALGQKGHDIVQSIEDYASRSPISMRRSNAEGATPSTTPAEQELADTPVAAMDAADRPDVTYDATPDALDTPSSSDQSGPEDITPPAYNEPQPFDNGEKPHDIPDVSMPITPYADQNSYESYTMGQPIQAYASSQAPSAVESDHPEKNLAVPPPTAPIIPKKRTLWQRLKDWRNQMSQHATQEDSRSRIRPRY